MNKDDGSPKAKHFATRLGFVRDVLQTERPGIELDFVTTADNQADLITEGLGKTETKKHFQQLSAKRGCQKEIWL